MIKFIIDLGPAHISALQHIAAGGDQGLLDAVLETRASNLFLAGVKRLKSERLVKHFHDESKPLGKRNWWELTEKGWLVFRILEIEVRDQQALLKRVGGSHALALSTHVRTVPKRKKG